VYKFPENFDLFLAWHVTDLMTGVFAEGIITDMEVHNRLAIKLSHWMSKVVHDYEEEIQKQDARAVEDRKVSAVGTKPARRVRQMCESY
jgi:hypothetical protein